MESPSWILYIAIVVLLMLSAFFSASETAISTVNKIRLHKKAKSGDSSAIAALSMAEHYDKTLFSILIGNNLVNIFSTAIATVIASALFGTSGAVIASLVMTVLVLTFGVILPKSYGNDHSEAFILIAAKPLRAIVWLLTPLTAFFAWLKSRISAPPEKGPSVTEEELHYIIGSIENEGVLEEQERELVQSALDFDEIAIHEILTPRVNIVALDIDSSIEEIQKVIVEERYSRIPVYEGTIDSIIGVLYSSDFLCNLVAGVPIDLRAMLGEPLFVHRSMRLSQMLANLKAHKVNLAVVTDDYGGTLGIVTMEDVLEELVGEIWDEDDEIPTGLVKLDDRTWEVEGDYNLIDMLEQLKLAEDDSDYTTVNGWAMHIFEHIPEVGEQFTTHGLTITVLEMDLHRIKKLGIVLNETEETEV